MSVEGLGMRVHGPVVESGRSCVQVDCLKSLQVDVPKKMKVVVPIGVKVDGPDL